MGRVAQQIIQHPFDVQRETPNPEGRLQLPFPLANIPQL